MGTKGLSGTQGQNTQAEATRLGAGNRLSEGLRQSVRGSLSSLLLSALSSASFCLFLSPCGSQAAAASPGTMELWDFGDHRPEDPRPWASLFKSRRVLTELAYASGGQPAVAEERRGRVVFLGQ